MLDPGGQRKFWPIAGGDHAWNVGAKFALWSGPVELMSLVLLGCRVGARGQLSAPAQRRAERAAAAFHSGISAHLLVCGGKRWGGPCEATALRACLLSLAVPEAAIECEIWSATTRENAHYAAQLLLPRGLQHIGLVTCDFHMARAEACFRGAGFDPEPLPALTPASTVLATWLRDARERVSLALDTLATRRFSSV